jgi:hypothetical protein
MPLFSDIRERAGRLPQDIGTGIFIMVRMAKFGYEHGLPILGCKNGCRSDQRR